jgi:hypothetical protein
MNQNNDDNYGYQNETEDYGQDYYDEGQETHDGEAEYEEQYDDSQLPVQEGRSFFQKYANIIIFGGVGIFALVMGYVNFGHVLFPPDNATNQIAAAPSDLLTPPVVSEETVIPAAPATAMSDAGAADGLPAVMPTPEMNPMGVSPTASVTAQTPDGGIALSPVAPTADPNDPWAEVATAPVTAATPESAPVAAAPAEMVAEPAPATPVIATAPQVTEVPEAEAAKLAEVQKKFEEAEVARQEQEAVIAELQNQLAEANAKAAAKPVDNEPSIEPAPKPKPKAKPAAAPKPKAAPAWELRSAADGTAWLSKRGDNQLFRVEIGDEVPGLGRVTAVREVNGRWYVVGTQGQISQ